MHAASRPLSGALAPAEVRDRLVAALDHLPELGFRPDDAAATRALVRELPAPALPAVAALAGQLRARIDTLPRDIPVLPAVPGLPDGQLFLLAFLATVGDVRAAHRGRRVPDDVSWRSLSDLGQQVWVHRNAYGQFGLHTHRWVAETAWAANLFWLGRLQFAVVAAAGGGWWLSVHIPQAGPLDPASVDDAFAQAERFAAGHLSDRPPVAFHCESWLLDPMLTSLLPGSNLARFQQRWNLFGPPRSGDADVLFFVFQRREPVPAADLPARTRLERVVRERWLAGGHWEARQGLVAGFGSTTARMEA